MIDKEKYPTPSRFFKRRLIKRVFRIFPYLKDKYFLEIGCGAGEPLCFLDSLGMKGEGIDLSHAAVNIATKRVSRNIRVYCSDFLAIRDRKYDLIQMIDVLEHIEDDKDAIRKISSLTNDGGYLLLHVPAHMKLFGNGDIFHGHYRRYEKLDLIGLLSKYGYETIVFWSYGVPFSANICSFLLRGGVSDNKEKSTLESGLKTPRFMKRIYPIIRGFYFLLYLNILTLNTDMGSQYLVLCKKRMRASEGR